MPSTVLAKETVGQKVQSITGQKPERIRLTDNAVLVRISFGRAGTQKTVKPSEVLMQTEGNVKLHKKLLNSPELKALERHDKRVKSYIDSRTNKPASSKKGIREGLRFLGISLIMEFDGAMRKYARERKALVDKLCDAYDNIKKSDKDRLTVRLVDNELISVYRDSDYLPVEKFREQFDLCWQYVELVPPRSLSAVSEDLLKEAEQQLRKQIEEDADAIRMALRIEMKTLVDWAIDRLTPGPDGKRKMFKTKNKDGSERGFTARLNDFLGVFEGRNITNDVELAEIVKQARDIMSGVKVDDLKDSEPLRDTLRGQFGDIKTVLDRWVEDAPIRKIELEGEESGD
jgi:hypothetical protein